jgi:hypothetical protein
MGRVVLPAYASGSKGRQNWRKENISNEKFDFVRSKNFQLLWQMKVKNKLFDF